MGNLKDALFFFREMQRSYLLPNKFTFGSSITGCARVRDSRTGAQIHCGTVKFGFELDTFIAGALIDMYAKCGKIDDSWEVFNQTPDKDVVSWTTMITSLVNSGECRYQNAAFEFFRDMVRTGVWPVSMTFSSLFKVFDEPSELKQAKQAHGHMVKTGIEVDDQLRSSLLAMYGRCGGIDEVVRLSLRMNHDLVSLTSLLAAYTQNGFDADAIEVFRRMVEEEMMIDRFVIVSVITACSTAREARKGKEVHGYALRRSFVSDVSVGNSLITLYGRCGEIRKSEQVFRLMGDRDTISWTAMLACYSQNGCGEEALSFFGQMLCEGLRPPVYFVTSAICACSQIANFHIGRQIHSRTVRMGIDANLSVGNSLITMYAKCGNIEDASRVFKYMVERDVVSWNALISGFSCHGFEKQALELFHLMKEEGVEPDNYTFIGILASCSRVGLVAEGWMYFRLMKAAYGLEPKLEHYACMVDLLGRAGRLREALDFVNCMPCEPDYLVWESLLASCKLHGDIELGQLAVKKIFEMRAEDASPYVTLSSIHASIGMWDRKAGFFDKMKERGLQKKPGRSWIVAQQWLNHTEVALQVGGT